MGLPAGANPLGASPQSSDVRFRVGGAPRSTFAARDLGRRAPLALVTASVKLRYNHQAELDALVAAQGDWHSPYYHRFLTNEQFNAYFAPTPGQHAAVLAALRAAGLRVTQTFSNRTLIDVAGTSAAAERFFGTEIHSVEQVPGGVRFANVKPITVPASLAALIEGVSLSNLIVARTGPRARPSHRAAVRIAALPGRHAVMLPKRFVVPPYAQPHAVPAGTNVIKDPGFESGAFATGTDGWRLCQSAKASPLATIVNTLAHTGKYSGHAGSTSTTSREQTDYAGVCQLVTVPADGVLAAYLYQLTDETSTANAGQNVLLLGGGGSTVATLATTLNNKAGWVHPSWNLSAYAGRNLYVYFGVYGDGKARTHTEQYVDDVTLSAPAATPTPTPTAKPTATPTAKPTATPTPSRCEGKAENGALFDEVGTLATGVAKAFEFPVQHGCNGAGETIGIVIDSPVEQSDVTAYMTAAGVTRTGTISNVAVDGGAPYDVNSDDTAEAALDIETVAGLAPAANGIVYNIPDLSDQSILDGYNTAVSANKVSVVNSSFGGCEIDDTTGDHSDNSIAEQGAVKGITFAAASGDSGSDECYDNNQPPAISSPSDAPYFTAVGGINFTENAAGVLTGINGHGDPLNGYLTGGGVSVIFGLPAFQKGVSGVITTGRNNPDLSLPGVGVAVFLGGQAFDAEGTSWASPQFTALLAEASQLRRTRFGWVNPQIYAIFKATGYADFTDVTVGSNGAYQDKTGYDQVAGIGAPKGYAFASSL